MNSSQLLSEPEQSDTDFPIRNSIVPCPANILIILITCGLTDLTCKDYDILENAVI